MHGKLLKDTLDAAGIDTTGMVVDPNFFTTLAFVSLNNGREAFPLPESRERIPSLTGRK